MHNHALSMRADSTGTVCKSTSQQGQPQGQREHAH